MKIGILTFHCAHNYGAVLQCYALQEYLKSLGHEVYVIDYRPGYIVSHRDYLRFNPKFLVTRQIKLLPKVFWTGLKLARVRNRKWIKFNDFKTHQLNLYPAKDFNGKGFDLCIVGSDQIWNKHITGGQFEPMYFGVGFRCPVISYAASTISDGFSQEDLAQLKRLLHGLQAVSVREERLKNQLAPIADSIISVVADPTILAGVKPFEALVKKDFSSRKGKYLLVYVIHDDPNLHRIARVLAQDNNWNLIEISAGFELKRFSTKIYDAGIEDFVTLFKNAEFIVTNSFHGTAFSILFSKNFYAVRQHNGVDVRLDQLLSEFDLLDRFIEPDSDIQALPINIDYMALDQSNNKYIAESEYFINNQLQTIARETSKIYKVSVIIPVYNAEKYLSEAIESVLSQTLKDIEILIINDGSSDDTASISDAYSNRYENVRVIHKANEGVSKARNIGIASALGEYILFLDSDDALTPDALEVLVREAEENKYCTFVQGAHKVLRGG